MCISLNVSLVSYRTCQSALRPLIYTVMEFTRGRLESLSRRLREIARRKEQERRENDARERGFKDFASHDTFLHRLSEKELTECFNKEYANEDTEKLTWPKEMVTLQQEEGMHLHERTSNTNHPPSKLRRRNSRGLLRKGQKVPGSEEGRIGYLLGGKECRRFK